ncbi:MAG: DUF2087 domain-containing protein [Thermovirgaceae bacterium]|nr:DUF2087 domain-containing protein [Thermovirgaceae bacterium]
MKIAIEAFERASIEELAEGVMEDPETHERVCLACGRTFAAGEVFQVDGRFWNAKAAAILHAAREHGPQFLNLLKLMHQWKGVSDTQEHLLEAFFRGDDDARIAVDLDISRSTVRNHRFKMKERARHAKAFIAMMRILEKNQKPETRLVDFPANTRIADDRFALTEEEYERITRKYFREDGTLERFPLKAKERVALLRKIVGMLVPGERYTEREMNTILSAVTDDHVLVRRCLVDYGFVSRVRDGSAYWVEL